MAKKEEKLIDESLLKGLMAQDAFTPKAKPVLQEEKPDVADMENTEPVHDNPKEESKRKKIRQPDYEEFYFRPTSSQAREGNSITIRKEFHERINRIVNIIGGDKVSLFSYVDNVLAQHFEAYQDEINELYKKNMNNLFKT